MLNRYVFFIVIFCFSVLSQSVQGKEFLRIAQPLTAEEEQLLLDHGYQIRGLKTLCVNQQEDELHFVGKIPLFNERGEKCFAYETVELPLHSLELPLSWEENVDQASLKYGPYALTLAKVNQCAIKTLRKVISEAKRGDAESVPPSQIALHYNYSRLVHSSRPENLLSILAAGELNASRGQTNRIRGDPFGNDLHVFCTLLKGEENRENLLSLTGNGLPILVFNLKKTLDQCCWHANTGHPLGVFSHLKTSDRKLFYSAHHTDAKRFAALLALPETSKRNEIVFYHPLSLDFLERIYVKKGNKEKFLKKLSDQKYASLIVEVEPLSQERLEFPSWIVAHSENSHDKVRYALEQSDQPLSDLISLMRIEYPQFESICKALGFEEGEEGKKWFKAFLEEADIIRGRR